ncbi:hypothetical protein [Pleomorphomonas oryzae]|uniref:hypothetical protein n=1 Tax=Pleomorphomonas oryzae TaxID=261934 RepID=UPI0006847443|nr:hypothetical protein [Pleomorphomonas oryzae]
MNEQEDIFSSVDEISLVRWLLADMHDDLAGKVSRFKQLEDLCSALGRGGTLMPGGEVVFKAWSEARASFVHGNYIATVMLCQSIAENILAAHLATFLHLDEPPPNRPAFRATLDRCVADGVVTVDDAVGLRKLMSLRNPLSHYRDLSDPANLSRRVLETQISADEHLFRDASFSIGMTVRLLSLPAFSLSGRTILDEDVG